MTQLELDTSKDYTFETRGGTWGLRYDHNADAWKCYGATFYGADKHEGCIWCNESIAECLQEGRWYDLKVSGDNPAPTTRPSAGILEPFDRVVTKYGTFIVADFKAGRYLVGSEGNWLDIDDFNATPVLAVHKAPVHMSDVFDFSLKGEKKWEHPNNIRQQELVAKIATLQQQLADADEELAALEQ